MSQGSPTPNDNPTGLGDTYVLFLSIELGSQAEAWRLLPAGKNRDGVGGSLTALSGKTAVCIIAATSSNCSCIDSESLDGRGENHGQCKRFP